jgi:hypothetical protein
MAFSLPPEGDIAKSDSIYAQEAKVRKKQKARFG